jgi:hypothetical protein
VSDSNVIKLAQPGAFTDSLTEILRSGSNAGASSSAPRAAVPMRRPRA